MLLLIFQKVAVDPPVEPPVNPPAGSSGFGSTKPIGKPWHFPALPVYAPVHHRRPRKRRQNDLLFLGK